MLYALFTATVFFLAFLWMQKYFSTREKSVCVKAGVMSKPSTLSFFFVERHKFDFCQAEVRIEIQFKLQLNWKTVTVFSKVGPKRCSSSAHAACPGFSWDGDNCLPSSAVV